jgi:hypothetical protein
VYIRDKFKEDGIRSTEVDNLFPMGNILMPSFGLQEITKGLLTILRSYDYVRRHPT